MTQLDAFLRAVKDAPDDDAPRLLLADWLEEQGDPRGEFIRLQLAPEDESRPASERRALRARESELLERHERGSTPENRERGERVVERGSREHPNR